MPNRSLTSAPQARSSFSRLASESASAPTNTRSTVWPAKIDALAVGKIGEVKPVARHPHPDRRLERQNEVELNLRRGAGAGAGPDHPHAALGWPFAPTIVPPDGRPAETTCGTGRRPGRRRSPSTGRAAGRCIPCRGACADRIAARRSPRRSASTRRCRRAARCRTDPRSSRRRSRAEFPCRRWGFSPIPPGRRAGRCRYGRACPGRIWRASPSRPQLSFASAEFPRFPAATSGAGDLASAPDSSPG